MALFCKRPDPSLTLVDQVAATIFEAEWEPLEWDDDTSGSDKREYRNTARRVIRLVLSASRIEARSDETPQEVRPEGQEPDPKGTPKTPLSHAEAKQPALSTGLSSSSPGGSPTSIEGASK